MRIAVMVLSLGLVLVVGFQSCAATVGGNMGNDESTAVAGGMGFFVVFLFLIAGAFALSFPIISLVTFLIAGTIAIAAGAPRGALVEGRCFARAVGLTLDLARRRALKS